MHNEGTFWVKGKRNNHMFLRHLSIIWQQEVEPIIEHANDNSCSILSHYITFRGGGELHSK